MLLVVVVVVVVLLLRLLVERPEGVEEVEKLDKHCPHRSRFYNSRLSSFRAGPAQVVVDEGPSHEN